MKNVILWSLLVCCGGLLCQSSAHAVARIEGIDMDRIPGTLQIGLSERVPFKLLKLDARQIMIAFKSADISPGVTRTLSGDHLVKQIRLEMLPDRVVSLMIYMSEDVADTQADWQGDSGTLLVRFVPSRDITPEVTPTEQKKTTEEENPEAPGRIAGSSPESAAPRPNQNAEPPPDQSEATLPPPAEVAVPEVVPASESALNVPAHVPTDMPMPPVSAPQKEAGLDGLISEISRSNCSQSPILADALKLVEHKEWDQLFKLLGPALDPNSKDPCQADLYYLRAFASYKGNRAGSDRLYLDAVNYFQDATSYFPESPYTPYGLLALATIYNDMNNYPEARGYYSIILKSYTDHPLRAEALFRLGALYTKENKLDQAITTFRNFIKEYPQSTRLTDVKLALGKCLYETDEFTEALAMLRDVMEKDQFRIYKDPDLLVYIGYLNYQLGHIESARDAMIRAVNLYPESDAVPDLLTRIADTLKSDNRTEQAKKVYQLVMEKYPGTDGFAISAVRYAGLLPSRAEKESQYLEVIKNFPDHPMAKLAAIRLADLQAQAGNYAASIDTLRGVMSGSMKGLQNEASYVMAAAFDGYLRQLTEKSDPIAVISAYEKDKQLIDRLDNPNIMEMIGTAFFNTHLYERAAELYQKSYRLSSSDNRPVNLYYLLGVTFQELGKRMQAREMFDAYFQKVPDDQIKPDAYLRMGQLLLAEKEWEGALGFLRTGFQKSESDLGKADFLLKQADAYEGLGEETKVPDLLTEAIRLMASSPEVRPERLMQAERSLGESYLKLSEVDKAIDAFTMALKFSTGSRPPGLLFLLADSNMKAHRLKAAKDVFLEIIDSGDDFWGRMAQERLQTMELETKLKAG